jgi:hypothetical protein
MDDLDPKERITKQKKNLKKRLGLDIEYTNLKEIIKDEDLVVSTLTKEERSKREQSELEAKKLSEEVLAQQLKSMSARERNVAKRKAKKKPQQSKKL